MPTIEGFKAAFRARSSNQKHLAERGGFVSAVEHATAFVMAG